MQKLLLVGLLLSGQSYGMNFSDFSIVGSEKDEKLPKKGKKNLKVGKDFDKNKGIIPFLSVASKIFSSPGTFVVESVTSAIQSVSGFSEWSNNGAGFDPGFEGIEEEKEEVVIVKKNGQEARETLTDNTMVKTLTMVQGKKELKLSDEEYAKCAKYTLEEKRFRLRDIIKQPVSKDNKEVTIALIDTALKGVNKKNFYAVPSDVIEEHKKEVNEIRQDFIEMCEK